LNTKLKLCVCRKGEGMISYLVLRIRLKAIVGTENKVACNLPISFLAADNVVYGTYCVVQGTAAICCEVLSRSIRSE
jgi:hypothetical protein